MSISCRVNAVERGQCQSHERGLLWGLKMGYKAARHELNAEALSEWVFWKTCASCDGRCQACRAERRGRKWLLGRHYDGEGCWIVVVVR